MSKKEDARMGTSKNVMSMQSNYDAARKTGLCKNNPVRALGLHESRSGDNCIAEMVFIRLMGRRCRVMDRVHAAGMLMHHAGPVHIKFSRICA